MKTWLPALLAVSMLSGCGAALNPTTARKLTPNVAQAKSVSGVSQAINQMIKAAFVAADKDGNGSLSLQELPVGEPINPADPGAPIDPNMARKDLMAKLDANKDGKVDLREFTRPEVVKPLVAQVRFQAGVAFSNLDRNGDRALMANELAGAPFTMEQLDLNKNGKVTISEFEDAITRIAAGPAPTPVAPPAPAPTPNEPVDPPAPEPVDPPAPAPAN